MRLTCLPAALVTGVLLVGAAACATTVEGSGAIASDVATDGPTPTGGSGSADPGGSGDPSGSDDPAPSSTPSSTSSSTPSAVRIRERTLCTLERAAVTAINLSFNKTKQRDQQVQILKQGTATLAGLLSRSGLPPDDGILRAGKAVQTQLARVYAAAEAGKSPSTKPYNDATAALQRACNAIP